MERYELPVQTPEALEGNRERAMAARSRYASAKAALKRREMRIDQVIADESLKRMRVVDVIAAMPYMGRQRAFKVMDELGIARSRRLGGIGCRQKAALLERFGGGQ